MSERRMQLQLRRGPSWADLLVWSLLCVSGGLGRTVPRSCVSRTSRGLQAAATSPCYPRGSVARARGCSCLRRSPPGSGLRWAALPCAFEAVGHCPVLALPGMSKLGQLQGGGRLITGGSVSPRQVPHRERHSRLCWGRVSARLPARGWFGRLYTWDRAQSPVRYEVRSGLPL